MLKALGSKIIVYRIDPTTHNGIIMPKIAAGKRDIYLAQYDVQIQYGTVVSIGRKVDIVKVGDKICFSRYLGRKIPGYVGFEVLEDGCVLGVVTDE
jgi:co-chaperonin GroES (HSP10)